jgi:hypothetical protein
LGILSYEIHTILWSNVIIFIWNYNGRYETKILAKKILRYFLSKILQKLRIFPEWALWMKHQILLCFQEIFDSWSPSRMWAWNWRSPNTQQLFRWRPGRGRPGMYGGPSQWQQSDKIKHFLLHKVYFLLMQSIYLIGNQWWPGDKWKSK